MRIPVLLITITALAGSALPLSAQSLADVAKKEAERRKTAQTGTTRSYSDKDLKPVPSAPSAPATSDASAAGQPATPPAPDAPVVEPSKPQGEKEAALATVGSAQTAPKDQKYWSRRIQDAHEKLERDRVVADALQTRVNSLTTDFVNRDDPAAQAQLALQRQKALAELDRLKKETAADAKAIADIEEEARRAGVPPGWLR